MHHNSYKNNTKVAKYYMGYLNQEGLSKTYGYNQYNIVLNTDALLLKDKSLKYTLAYKRGRVKLCFEY